MVLYRCKPTHDTEYISEGSLSTSLKVVFALIWVIKTFLRGFSNSAFFSVEFLFRKWVLNFKMILKFFISGFKGVWHMDSFSYCLRYQRHCLELTSHSSLAFLELVQSQDQSHLPLTDLDPKSRVRHGEILAQGQDEAILMLSLR